MERGTSTGIRTGIWGKLKLVPYLSYWKLFLIRVAEGLGIVRNSDISRDLFKLYWSWGIIQRNELKICILPEAGRLENVVSGVPFISKLFSLFGGIDAVQTVALNQPFLGGNIAPNERLGLVNPNGGTRGMTYPGLYFSATDKWTISFLVRNNESTEDFHVVVAGVNGIGFIAFKSDTHTLYFRNSLSTLYSSGSNTHRSFIGKWAYYSFVADGEGTISMYINAILISQQPAITSFNPYYLNGNGVNRYFPGIIGFYSVKNINLNIAQILQESNFLKSIFPEVPSVAIGTQVWATSNLDVVCTPKGNLIPNVTDNANVEKVTSGGFDTDTWWLKNGASVSINGGVGNYINSPRGDNFQANASGSAVAGRWYKITFSVTIVSGGVYYNFGTSSTAKTISGTYSEYVLCTAAGQWFIAASVNNTNATIDNVSVQIVGWSDSQNLYDYIYANTTGTVEQKTYAAVKAAAMWSYYNNDASIGAIYGKLYNWFAVKLMQMDIDYYNAANPTTPWGCRIPTQADFETLQTALGGASVAGGKMKKEGLAYWSSPNTGANNESGFSAIGVPRRADDGTFQVMGIFTHFWTINSYIYYLNSSDSILYNSIVGYTTGRTIRLIKS